jgi:hypothetical protein
MSRTDREKANMDKLDQLPKPFAKSCGGHWPLPYQLAPPISMFTRREDETTETEFGDKCYYDAATAKNGSCFARTEIVPTT